MSDDATTRPGRQAAVDGMCEVSGIGEVTAAYFLMLLGFDGVKADRMVRRYGRFVAGR